MDWLLEVRASEDERPRRWVFDALDRSEADSYAARILTEWRKTDGARVSEVRFAPLPSPFAVEDQVSDAVRWRAPLADRP